MELMIHPTYDSSGVLVDRLSGQPLEESQRLWQGARPNVTFAGKQYDASTRRVAHR
jgi:hypothetical protein